jgi:riboflavin kinase/FMN adenylyltransferase
MGKIYGFQVEVLEKEQDGPEAISSTRIRSELEKGNMEAVNRLLGYPWFVTGKVLHGRGMGGKLLFPTTNLIPPREKLLPPNGVYVTSSRFPHETFRGVTNIGFKPTVGESFCGVETYLYNCNQDLYGKTCRVEFYHFQRPERKFPSLEALKEQLACDIRECAPEK